MVCVIKKKYSECKDTFTAYTTPTTYQSAYPTPSSTRSSSPPTTLVPSGLTTTTTSSSTTDIEPFDLIPTSTEPYSDQQQQKTSSNNVLTYSAGGAAAGLFCLAAAGVGFMYRRRYSAAELQEDVPAPNVSINPLYEGKIGLTILKRQFD